MKVVETVNLFKSYGTGNTKVDAVKDINLSINQGNL